MYSWYFVEEFCNYNILPFVPHVHCVSLSNLASGWRGDLTSLFYMIFKGSLF